MAQVLATIEGDVGSRGLQGLVNNAGVGTGGPVEYVSEDDWRWVFDINLFSVVALSQAAIPLLRAGGGRIVHIGSIGGRLAAPGLGPYSASKHALEALAETQRQELGRVEPAIRVSLIEPGEVKTAIWDKSDELANDFEAKLDDVGRNRYQWLIDMTRGFISEGRTQGGAAGEGGRGDRARADGGPAEGALPRGAGRQGRGPRRLEAAGPGPRRVRRVQHRTLGEVRPQARRLRLSRARAGRAQMCERRDSNPQAPKDTRT